MAQTVFERFAAAKLDFYTIAKFKNEVILPFKQELERVSNDTWKVYNVQKSNRKTISGLESYFEAKLWNSSQATKGEVSVAMLSHNGQLISYTVQTLIEHKGHTILTEHLDTKSLQEVDHWVTNFKVPPHVVTEMQEPPFPHGQDHTAAMRVLAKYKSKKTVKTKDGDDMTVYEYSDRQVANRDKKKAERIEKLKGSIGKLRTQYKKDLTSKDPETAHTALAVGLMDTTMERVGNDSSAKEGHFGVTGWRKKHVTFGTNGATIKYVGKSGVDHEKKVTDPAVKKALKKAYDETEKDNDVILSHVGASKVNEYLKKFDVTAKDIRGYHANTTMVDELKAIRAKGKKLPEDKKDREKILKKEFLKALDETAEAVGHEPSTLRSQYLVDSIEDEYMKDGTVPSKFE